MAWKEKKALRAPLSWRCRVDWLGMIKERNGKHGEAFGKRRFSVRVPLHLLPANMHNVMKCFITLLGTLWRYLLLTWMIIWAEEIK